MENSKIVSLSEETEKLKKNELDAISDAEASIRGVYDKPSQLATVTNLKIKFAGRTPAKSRLNLRTHITTRQAIMLMDYVSMLEHAVNLMNSELSGRVDAHKALRASVSHDDGAE